MQDVSAFFYCFFVIENTFPNFQIFCFGVILKYWEYVCFQNDPFPLNFLHVTAILSKQFIKMLGNVINSICSKILENNHHDAQLNSHLFMLLQSATVKIGVL